MNNVGQFSTGSERDGGEENAEEDDEEFYDLEEDPDYQISTYRLSINNENYLYDNKDNEQADLRDDGDYEDKKEEADKAAYRYTSVNESRFD